MPVTTMPCPQALGARLRAVRLRRLPLRRHLLISNIESRFQHEDADELAKTMDREAIQLVERLAARGFQLF